MKIKNSIIATIVTIVFVIILLSIIPIPSGIVGLFFGHFIGADFLNYFQIDIETLTDGISGIVTIIIVLLIIYLYNKHYKKEGFKGLINFNLKDLIFLIPIVICLVLSLAFGGPIIHTAVTLTLICLIMEGAGAAFLEETLFRGIMISSLMRIFKSENKIIITWILSGLLFGLVHIFNIFGGANPLATVFQVILTLCVGLVFAAIYLRTGDLWIPILGHVLNNFAAALTTTGPITTEFTFSIGTCVELIISVVFLIYAFYLIRSSKRDEITALWDDRWSKI